MSYQVIARKYRPQRFSDVVGQEHVTRTLSNAIQQNRIAHAYLFVGPRGTGKTTLARIFAKCLNCTEGPNVDFADDDPRCQEIADGRALDVLEIDGASNRGIEEVRELRETVKYAPATSRFKIYIIDEVHMLTKEAFNALLKTLEEPPAHVKFMFATTEPEKVLATILSRCQRFDLRRIPAALIVEHLGRIAALEDVKIDDAALHAIARGADGGMRDAQSALDQLISFCGREIVEDDVLSMFGLTARGQVFSLARSILGGESHAALHELDDLAKKGKDLARLLADLLNYLRNLLLFQISHGDLSLLDVSEAEAATLGEQSKNVTAEALTRMMDILSEHEGRLRDAASKRILIEIALLKAIQARESVSIDSVLQKLHSMRSEAGSDGSTPTAPATPAALATTASSARAVTVPPARTAPAAAKRPPTSPPAAVAQGNPSDSTPASEPSQPQPASAPKPASAAPPQAQPQPSAQPKAQLKAQSTAASQPPDLRKLWLQVIDAVGQASPFARTYLAKAHPVSLIRNVLTIGFAREFSDHFGLADNQKNRALIQTALQEMGIADAHVRFVEAEPAADWAPAVQASEPVELEAPAIAPPSPDPGTSAAAKPSASASPIAGASGRAGVAPIPKAAQSAPVEIVDFKNDPLIKQALEIFKGQIVEARG